MRLLHVSLSHLALKGSQLAADFTSSFRSPAVDKTHLETMSGKLKRAWRCFIQAFYGHLNTFMST